MLNILHNAEFKYIFALLHSEMCILGFFLLLITVMEHWLPSQILSSKSICAFIFFL